MANQEAVKESESYDYYLTTKDNPYDPKTQYDEWYAYDSMLGYNTPQRIARMIDYLTEQLRLDSEKFVYTAALKELVRLDPLKVYTIRRYPSQAAQTVQLSDDMKAQVELAKNL